MNVQVIMPIAFLGSVAINVIHWRGRKDERLLYHPSAGWLRRLFTVWMIAMATTGVLFLGGFIPGPLFMGVAWGFTITHELYSIARRQHQRMHRFQRVDNALPAEP